MIVISGASGFIGSCLVGKLNQEGFKNLVLVDEFDTPSKRLNLTHKQYIKKVDRNVFFPWLEKNAKDIQFVFHLGARTDTTEKDEQIFLDLNTNYSKKIWSVCVKNYIPLIYASSAATYGNCETKCLDIHEEIKGLRPLNAYGKSKNDFDNWVLQQKDMPFFWAGFKFFNVYGPNEYHKGRMASIIYHLFKQAKDKDKVRLFRSHRNNCADGEQKRDFVYVKDVVNVLYHFMNHRQNSGIYNLGTGKAKSYNDLAGQIFKHIDKEKNIDYFDIPEDIRETYQYFTEASIDKLRTAGYDSDFFSLDEGVKDYVNDYLSADFKIY